MIGLDITVRGPEERSYRKSFDTFTVLGPWLVTAEEFGDPANVDFKSRSTAKAVKRRTRAISSSVPGGSSRIPPVRTPWSRAT
jgi:2-keto-4-pentenoate hydratase/2-oxohepta-3-ene-1,7-dioic acid hydratase in catechol pathway